MILLLQQKYEPACLIQALARLTKLTAANVIESIQRKIVQFDLPRNFVLMKQES